jgi:hypothetical protein
MEKGDLLEDGNNARRMLGKIHWLATFQAPLLCHFFLLLFLTTPIIPKNTHRKSICLSGFLLFTPKSWIFYVDLSFHT